MPPMNDECATTNTEATLQRARRFKASVHSDLAKIDLVATPPGYTLHNLEHLLNRPTRQRAVVHVTTAESFARAMRDGTDVSRIYVDERKGTFAGYIDHGSEFAPGWRDHQVHYAPAYSIEFEEWHRLASAGPITQDVLARFFEEHLQDVSSMPGSDVLAMVREFRVSMNGSFASATNLANGSIEFAYAMENRGKSSIEIPELVMITVPMFEGTPAIEIPIRFRYRLKEGQLTFNLELAGFPRLRQRELRGIRSDIAARLPEIPMLDGAIRA